MALQKRYAERNVPGSRWQVAQRRAALSQWTCIHTYIYEASQLVWRWLHFNCFSRCNSITAHVCLAAKRFALNARICLWFSTQPHTATGEIPPSPSSPSAHAISSIVQNQTDLGVSARPACAICCVCVCARRAQHSTVGACPERTLRNHAHTFWCARFRWCCGCGCCCCSWWWCNSRIHYVLLLWVKQSVGGGLCAHFPVCAASAHYEFMQSAKEVMSCAIWIANMVCLNWRWQRMDISRISQLMLAVHGAYLNEE